MKISLTRPKGIKGAQIDRTEFTKFESSSTLQNHVTYAMKE
jgi:hypothetical protein